MIDLVLEFGRNEIGFGRRTRVPADGYPEGVMPDGTVRKALAFLERDERIARKLEPALRVNRRWKILKGKRAPAFYKVVERYKPGSPPVGGADLAEIRRHHGEMLQTYRELRDDGENEAEALELANATYS